MRASGKPPPRINVPLKLGGGALARQFEPHVLSKLEASRPDVLKALVTRDVSALATDATVLPSWFKREALPPYFSEADDPFSPVTLYRGVDLGQPESDFIGEKYLVWASTRALDAFAYAFSGAGNRPQDVSVIRYTVPKFMVAQRSGWPVLRQEDVVDQYPFIHSIATVKLDGPLAAFVRDHPGEDQALAKYLKKNLAGALEGTSPHWARAT